MAVRSLEIMVPKEPYLASPAHKFEKSYAAIYVASFEGEDCEWILTKLEFNKQTNQIKEHWVWKTAKKSPQTSPQTALTSPQTSPQTALETAKEGTLKHSESKESQEVKTSPQTSPQTALKPQTSPPKAKKAKKSPKTAKKSPKTAKKVVQATKVNAMKAKK